MKKLICTLLLIIIIAVGCDKKEDVTPDKPEAPPVITYCAKCTESYTGVTSDQYCGTLDEVNKFISELKKIGAQYGQNWSCSKWKKN